MRLARPMHRVLVVDDEPLISMMVKDWLTELGYDPVGPAESVAGALHLLGQELDAAILDVSLGNQECYSVAHALRERGVPFAFATGNGGVLAPGFDKVPILAKPFDFEAVKRILLALIGSRTDKPGF
jgi:DNA-binding response OmpR family regulator